MVEQEHQKKTHRMITLKVRHLVIFLVVLLIVIFGFMQLTKFNEQTSVTTEENQDSKEIIEKDTQTTQTIENEESLTNTTKQEVITDNEIPASKIAKKLGITIEERPSLGSENAPVTIIAFIDPVYTHYAYFYNNVLPQLRERYVENGKVRIIFKHYVELGWSRTLDEFIRTDSYHQYLKIFAITNCAYNIDVEKFLLAQSTINQKFEDYFYTADYEKVVTKFYSPLGLSSTEFERFKKCPIYSYNDEIVKIKKDFEEGKKLDMVRTTFFINTEKIDGIQTFATFDRIIKQKLGEKVEAGKCFSYKDCPEEKPYCLSDGVCSSVECNVEDDCNYFNNLGYQACVDRCDKYNSYFTGETACENGFCKCSCGY